MTFNLSDLVKATEEAAKAKAPKETTPPTAKEKRVLESNGALFVALQGKDMFLAHPDCEVGSIGWVLKTSDGVTTAAAKVKDPGLVTGRIVVVDYVHRKSHKGLKVVIAYTAEDNVKRDFLASVKESQG